MSSLSWKLSTNQGAEGSFDFLALVVADIRKDIEILQVSPH
jgi:hypothetical protein